MGTTKLKDRGVKLERLTDKQRLFVSHYLSDPNATKAAIAAGYSKKVAYATGNKLLQHPLIAIAIGKGTKTILDQHKLEAVDVLKQLFCLLTRDIADFVNTDNTIKGIHDMPYNARMCVDSIEVEEYIDEEGNDVKKTKLKLSPKATAVDMAMKHKGLFAALKVEGKVSIDWDSMFTPTNRDEDEESDVVEQRLLNLE